MAGDTFTCDPNGHPTSNFCVVQAPATFTAGTYKWWVQAWNDAGAGPWSAGVSFTVPLPAKATPVFPSGDVPTHRFGGFGWSDVPGATWYYLWVNEGSTNLTKRWYRAEDLFCEEGSCGAPIPDAVDFEPGDYTWWVQTWSPAGYGPWSDATKFTLFAE